MSELHPTVSVVMITYNHENYIRQAIEGVLMQKTLFRYELIIGEDCSTDKTRQICFEYKNKYPDQIKLLLPQTNQGIMQNFYSTLRESNGKYVALCEGDDYWTDPFKLQKQVDFLEANEEYSLCFHKVNVKYEDNLKDEGILHYFEEREYSGLEIYKEWIISTCSVVFRNYRDLLFHKSIIYCDIYLFLLLSERGKIFGLGFDGATYRRNINGASVTVSPKLVRRLYYQYKYMFYRFPKYKSISKEQTNYYFDNLINRPYYAGSFKFRFLCMCKTPRKIFSKYFFRSFPFLLKDMNSYFHKIIKF